MSSNIGTRIMGNWARSQIVRGVWIGDEGDAQKLWYQPGWTVIDVREADTASDPAHVVRIPLLRKETGGNAGQRALLEITTAIDTALAKGDQVIVHCWAGMERSPLSVAGWLVMSRGLTLDEAYTLLQSRRSVYDRRDWMTKKARRSLEGVTRVTPEPLRAVGAESLDPLAIGD